MRIFCLIVLTLPLLLFAQKKKNKDAVSAILTQPDRVEFEVTKERSYFHVVPAEHLGILVIEEIPSGNLAGGFEWKFHMVDTAFNVVWSREQEIETDGGLLGFDYFGGKFFLIFGKNRYRSEELIVLELNAWDEQTKIYEITTVFPVKITHFLSAGETLLIGGYANFRPVVITYNINEKKPQVVPGFYDNKNMMLDIIVDRETKFFTVIQSEKMRNKKSTVRVKTFTEKGDLIQDNLVNPGDRVSLLDAASTTFSNGLQYLAGTHSRKSPLYSQGFYLSKFINGAQQFNKYYAFADLENFFNHMKPKKESRIKSRIEKKKEKGKVKKFSYRLLVHKILQRDDTYIMIAEAYYPRYNYGNTNSFTPPTFNSYNANRQQNFDPYNPNFLGYKYTHAVVVGFDENCNILWDHTFKIEDTQSYQLDEHVMVTSGRGDQIILSYLEENEIRSKVIKNNEIVEGRSFSPVRLSFEADEIRNKNPNVEGIERWYGKTLFAYGVQSIKNEHGVGGKYNRKVFYLNKLRFDLNPELN